MSANIASSSLAMTSSVLPTTRRVPGSCSHLHSPRTVQWQGAQKDTAVCRRVAQVTEQAVMLSSEKQACEEECREAVLRKHRALQRLCLATGFDMPPSADDVAALDDFSVASADENAVHC